MASSNRVIVVADLEIPGKTPVRRYRAMAQSTSDIPRRGDFIEFPLDIKPSNGGTAFIVGDRVHVPGVGVLLVCCITFDQIALAIIADDMWLDRLPPPVENKPAPLSKVLFEARLGVISSNKVTFQACCVSHIPNVGDIIAADPLDIYTAHCTVTRIVYRQQPNKPFGVSLPLVECELKNEEAVAAFDNNPVWTRQKNYTPPTNTECI
jgi:hypothetical protein